MFDENDEENELLEEKLFRSYNLYKKNDNFKNVMNKLY